MEQQIDPRRIEQLLKMMQAEEANNNISQTDGININQAEGNVPGVYISSYQQQQDAYAQQLLQQQTANAYDRQEQMYYAPPKADAFDTNPMMYAMGNPAYRTVTEGQNTTVNSNGDIVHY